MPKFTLNLRIALAACGLLAMPAIAKDYLAYIGTYTGPRSQGIYSARFDTKTGTLRDLQLAAETKNPSFLALHPNARFLYAVGEIGNFEGKPVGAVSAFQIERPSGKLTLLNQQPSGGAGPTHLAVDATGRCVLVANYGGGSVAALPIGKDGKLAPMAAFVQHEGSSVNPKRQAGPHAHHILPDPGNRFALVCDLGLDQVRIYRLNAAKALLEPHGRAALAPGAGPRHLTFSPNGQEIYVINELDCTLTVFDWDARAGAMTERQTLSTLPPDFGGENSCAEVQAHPSGRFVYGSNRGHDSIAVFAVNPKTGRLNLTECEPTRGKAPRYFGLAPGGQWLLAGNQGTDTIVVFKVDSKTGDLNPAGSRIEVGAPVCIVFTR